MAKSFTCRDVGVPCDWKATGETEDEVMQQTAAHAKDVHGIDPIPADMASKVQSAIKEV